MYTLKKTLSSANEKLSSLFAKTRILDIYEKRDIGLGICKSAAYSSVCYVTASNALQTYNTFRFLGFEATALLIISIFQIGVYAATLRMTLLPFFYASTVARLTEDQSKKKVLLFCRSSSDWNGAMGIRENILNALKEYSKTHSIVFVKTNEVDDINNAIDSLHKTNRKITDIWLACHGKSDECLVGKNHLIGNKKLYFSKLYKFLKRIVQKVDKERGILQTVDKIHFDKLARSANIILQSCSVGKQASEGSLNIAEWFQYYAGKNRKVFAPRAMITANSINFTNIGQNNLDVTFKDLFWRDRTAHISYNEVANKVKQLQFLNLNSLSI